MAPTTVQAVPKLYDVIMWLLGRVEKFPRSQKFTLGDRTVNLALDTLELLIEATYTRDRLHLLRKANVQLEKLRYLIRICHDFKLLSAKQFAYISNEINEVGKLVGGWITQFRRKIRDAQVLWLIDLIVDNSNPQEYVHEYFEGDDLLTPLNQQRGIPIGNLTSQFFANIYLNRFDHFVKEDLRCRYYIRYMDDFVVLEKDKARLHQMKAEMAGYLAQFRLKLHAHKCQIFPVKDGTDFLGYQVFPTHRRLRPSSVRRARRRLRRLREDYEHEKISWADVNHSVQSWLGHVKHADTYGLRRAIFSQTIFRRS